MDGTGLTGGDLLRWAAEDSRAEPHTWVGDDELAAIFDAAAEAFPIDHSEPPRNLLDRTLVLACLHLAGTLRDAEDG